MREEIALAEPAQWLFSRVFNKGSFLGGLDRPQRGHLEEAFPVFCLRTRFWPTEVFMQNLASALAAASSYLDSRTEAFTEDDNVAILENIGAILQAATAEEKRAVIAALADIGRTDLVDGLGIE